MLLLSSAGRAAGMLGHRWRQAGGRPADGQHRPGGVAVGDLCTEALRKVRTPSVQALFGEKTEVEFRKNSDLGYKFEHML